MNIDHLFVRSCCGALSEICGLDYKIDELPPHIAVSDAWWGEVRTLGEGNNDERRAGTDLLGVYLAEKEREPTNRIQLFRRSIESYAFHTGYRMEGIKEVVLIHELAHSVTHLGKCTCSMKMWAHFGKACACEKERMAQIATFLLLMERAEASLLQVFTKMSEDSPAEYHGWKEYNGTNMGIDCLKHQFRKELASAREHHDKDSTFKE